MHQCAGVGAWDARFVEFDSSRARAPLAEGSTRILTHEGQRSLAARARTIASMRWGSSSKKAPCGHTTAGCSVRGIRRRRRLQAKSSASGGGEGPTHIVATLGYALRAAAVEVDGDALVLDEARGCEHRGGVVTAELHHQRPLVRQRVGEG